MSIFEATDSKGFAAMVFVGKQLKQPIAWRGPIVMNSWKEINSAYQELRSGKFLKKRVNFNYREEL